MNVLKCVSKVLGQMWALLALRKCPRTFETHFITLVIGYCDYLGTNHKDIIVIRQ